LHTDLSPGPTLIMAPIHGVTDVVYRRAFAAVFGGFDRAVAPFFRARRGHRLRPVELWQVAPENNPGMPAIPQLLTSDAETFADALQALFDAGHREANWNLGCPTRNVAGRGRGAGLLPHPDRIDEILTAVLDRTPIQLSVKIRLGYHDPDEHLAVIDVLNRHPLSEVILHARTADQLYHDVPDLERARNALTLCRHPFVYNGDIATPDGFAALQEQLPGVAGWMIGRGALTWPSLPSLIKGCAAARSATETGPCPPAPRSDSARLRQFHDLMFSDYEKWLSGPGHLLDRMKTQWAYLACSFAKSTSVASRVRHARDVNTYEAAVEWAFEQPLRA
jgi:tRNA-dihydrouridine synthase B